MPHYYGDTVRSLMLAAAALMLVGVPFYGADLRPELPVFVTAMLILVCLAAFTSPRNRAVLIADAIVTGAGMVIFEMWALASYTSIPLSAFALRQAVALLFLFAFYFSGKTIRALVIEGQSEEEEEGGGGEIRPPLDPSPDEDDYVSTEEEEKEYENRRRHARPFQLPEDRSDD